MESFSLEHLPAITQSLLYAKHKSPHPSKISESIFSNVILGTCYGF